MKHKLIVLGTAIMLIPQLIKAQNVYNDIAYKHAQRMVDSLQLHDSLRLKLYSINIQLHQRKILEREQHAGSDSLSYYIQKVENRRDSLYHSVLAEEKYLLYKSKKKQLINNN
jgi:hypothetical protein